jgi:hypothetical protein
MYVRNRLVLRVAKVQHLSHSTKQLKEKLLTKKRMQEKVPFLHP